MFYVIVALWLIACAASYLLGKARLKFLAASCPCVAVGGLVIFGLLLLLDHTLAAVIVLAAALYIWIILRWTMARQHHHEMLAH